MLAWLVGSDFLFWTGLHVARDRVTQKVLATSLDQLTAASPQERARVNAIVDHILPLSERAEGMRGDVEARFADLRRPPVSVWEHRAACRELRAAGHRRISESLIFQAMERQRQILSRASRDTRLARGYRSTAPEAVPTLLIRRPSDVVPSPIDYDLPAPDDHVEQW